MQKMSQVLSTIQAPQSCSDISNFAKKTEGATLPSLLPRHEDIATAIEQMPRWVNTLFTRLQNIYGTSWTIKIPDDVKEYMLKMEWFKTLKDVPRERMGIGLKRLPHDPRFIDFPPNPLQFKQLCGFTGQELNVPDFHEAFKLATMQRYAKHPFVSLVCKGLDMYRFRMLPAHEAERKFRVVYDIARAQALREGTRYEKAETTLSTPIPSRHETPQESAEAKNRADMVAEKHLQLMREATGARKYVENARKTAIELRGEEIDKPGMWDGEK